MNVKKTPLQQVNQDHGGKSKLVDAVLGMIDIGEEDKDSAKARLLKASNKKLLRLRANSTAVKEKYGSVDKLVANVADKLGRAKDSDFVKHLSAFSPAKLLDRARSLAGEARRPLKAVIAKVEKAVAKPVKAAAKKATKATKAPAKKPANKKAAVARSTAKKAAAKKAGKK